MEKCYMIVKHDIIENTTDYFYFRTRDKAEKSMKRILEEFGDKVIVEIIEKEII